MLQPVNFFDWFNNFSLASNKTGSSYAAMGNVTAGELSGYNAGPNAAAWIQDHADGPGACALLCCKHACSHVDSPNMQHAEMR